MKKLLPDSFIIRIYRCAKDKPNSLVGVAEKVGKQERLAFTSLDELWGILTSSGRVPMPKKIGVSARSGHAAEQRNEMRIKKEIPLVFIFNKRKCNGNTINCSKNGLYIFRLSRYERNLLCNSALPMISARSLSFLLFLGRGVAIERELTASEFDA